MQNSTKGIPVISRDFVQYVFVQYINHQIVYSIDGCPVLSSPVQPYLVQYGSFCESNAPLEKKKLIDKIKPFLFGLYILNSSRMKIYIQLYYISLRGKKVKRK